MGRIGLVGQVWGITFLLEENKKYLNV